MAAVVDSAEAGSSLPESLLQVSVGKEVSIVTQNAVGVGGAGTASQ